MRNFQNFLKRRVGRVVVAASRFGYRYLAFFSRILRTATWMEELEQRRQRGAAQTVGNSNTIMKTSTVVHPISTSTAVLLLSSIVVPVCVLYGTQ